ncbi:MAG: hypothetical protein AAFV53_07905 [Myxococcota bacterium]
MRLRLLAVAALMATTGCDTTDEQFECECTASYTDADGETFDDDLLDSVTVVGDDGVSVYEEETCQDLCLDLENDGATIGSCDPSCDTTE